MTQHHETYSDPEVCCLMDGPCLPPLALASVCLVVSLDCTGMCRCAAFWTRSWPLFCRF